MLLSIFSSIIGIVTNVRHRIEFDGVQRCLGYLGCLSEVFGQNVDIVRFAEAF